MTRSINPEGAGVGARLVPDRAAGGAEQRDASVAAAPVHNVDVLKCGRCGEQNPSGARFCNGCGCALADDAPAGAPRNHTPRHLAEKIRTSRGSVEGERKHVTVLFADVKGSMELLADRDPEEARELLDAVVQRMMDAVHRYEGTVNQVMGDGIMALFGAPLACEDHAVRACFAALRIREEVGRYAQEQQDPIQVRIGLNSGEVVVRSISNDLHMDYSAVGQTTHLAARMEQIAGPGCAVITGSTLRLAGESVSVRPLGAQRIKGLEQPIEVYELLGATPVRSLAHVAATQATSHFVGREAELAAIQDLIQEVEAGRGRAVSITGEAGIGKSRLVYQVMASQRWRVLGSSAQSYERGSSWAPVIGLLRSYFDLDNLAGSAEIVARVSARMRRLDPRLEADIAPVLSLLGALPADDGFRSLDARERRQRQIAALTRLLLAQSEHEPLLLVFENLQWIDEESRAFLDALIARLPGNRLLLVMNYRLEFTHGWQGRAGYSEMALEPLQPHAARELLKPLLGEHRSLAPLLELLIERSNGNPFFLEEIVQDLVETRAIEGDPGERRLVAGMNALEVPPTVQDVIAARIDRLAPELKLLLQQASVIGTEVPLALLEAVAGISGESAAQALYSLQQSGFVVQTGCFPDVEYRFRHVLTREVAYSSLLKDQRRVLHVRALDAMEVLFGNTLGRHLQALARHAVRGALWDKAVTYNRQLGLRGLERAANTEAVACFEEALRALARLPATRANTEAEIEIRSALRPALLQLGRLDEVHALSKHIERMARELGDDRHLALAYTWLINYHYLKGETGLTLDYGRRCMAIAAGTGDAATQMLARQYMGQSYHARGEYRLAEAELERNVVIADAAGSRTCYVSSSAWLAFSLADRGEFDAAERHARAARDAAEASNHVYNRLIALTLYGLVALRRGNVAHAVLPLQLSLAICRDRGVTVWQPVCSSLLGLALTRLGDTAEGLRLLEEGVVLSGKLGVTAYLSAWTANLAEGQLAAGQVETALATAREALRLARDAGERGHEACALWLVGLIESAPETTERAYALAVELGIHPLAAQIRFDLARDRATRGHAQRGAELVSQAEEAFTRMGMRPWRNAGETGCATPDRLYVVARSNVRLYEFLRQEFTIRNMEVVLDRRERKRQPVGQGGERRRQAVDAELGAWDLALSFAAPA